MVEDLDTGPAEVDVGGFGAYRDQLTELSKTDLERAERVGLPIVFVVLLVTFGSFWAAGLPLVIALSALVMGLGAVGACAMVLPLSDFVTNAASMIGVALGVDYAMFLVQRVRELMREGADRRRRRPRRDGPHRRRRAVVRPHGLAGEATLLLVDSRSIRSAAFGMVMVTVFAVLTALVVAPVVISLLGHRITRSERFALPAHRRGLWERWARARHEARGAVARRQRGRADRARPAGHRSARRGAHLRRVDPAPRRLGPAGVRRRRRARTDPGC